MTSFSAITLRVLFLVHVLPGVLSAQITAPVLDFPTPHLDDPEAYRGYVTRFYRDGNGNTVQISLVQHTGRVVHVWGNAANESLGFTAGDQEGHPEPLTWEGCEAIKGTRDGMQLVRYALRSQSSRISLGLFLLGSMRREREFRYAQRHLEAFGTEREFVPSEITEFLDLISRLPSNYREQLLKTLQANSVEDLNARTKPRISIVGEHSTTSIEILQHSFDLKNRLLLKVTVQSSDVSFDTTRGEIAIRSSNGSPLTIQVTIGTDASPLTPVGRKELFSDEFLQFLDVTSPDHPRLERQVLSFELMSSREKLMAGLPNFATYFGRDMIMTMLMLEPVLRPSVQEHAITTILQKLSPGGEVSHEESLGGQAIRENVAAANRLLRHALETASSDSVMRLVTEAAAITSDLQRVREDYRMLDDDFQLPVLVGRYLQRPDVTRDLKQAFLRHRIGDHSVLRLLLRNLSFVADQSAAYVRNQTARNLIAFPSLGSGRWLSGSWRDSNAGYANGRYAMDINAIWVPEALAATRTILQVLSSWGVTVDSLESVSSEIRESSLSSYARDSSLLERAIRVWRMAINHFLIIMPESDVRARVQLRLAGLSAEERQYWESEFERIQVPRLYRFLALALDSNGTAIPIPHTDGVTLLFLRNLAGTDLLDPVLTPVFTPYPVGLFIEGLGPVSANDTYASKKIWEEFRNDRYHSPYVVWGREVNLLLLGLWKQMFFAGESSNISARLWEGWKTISDAAEASGLSHNELWTSTIENGILLPARYPTGSDIQAWNITDLSMQFLLWKHNSQQSTERDRP